jgi:hypothetical protein
MWRAAKLGGLALVLLLPTVLYVTRHFGFLETTAIRQSGQAISALLRQPHHAVIRSWWSWGEVLQVSIIAAGLILSWRRRRLFLVLLQCTIAMVGLTLLQAVSGSLDLALLFPWRATVWLIPVSTAIVLGFAANHVGRYLSADRVNPTHGFVTTGVLLLAAATLVGLCCVGANRTATDARTDRDRGRVISYAKAHLAPGQTYLVPVTFERFRLAASAPIFVDWKSFPYRGAEIVEWYNRLQLASAFYDAESATDAVAALTRIQEHARVTHIIIPREAGDTCDAVGGKLEFADQDYGLCSLEEGDGA